MVLLLGGDPGLATSMASRPATLSWLGRFVVPPNLLLPRTGSPAPTDPNAPWPFPPDQVMCAQRLIDAARRAGRTVRIVDVNRPGNDRDFVERFVGPGDVLPIAIRADGARLEGAEAFAPGAVRRFLQVP